MIHPVTAAQFAASNVHLPTFQKYLTDNNAALTVSFDVTKRDRHDTQQPFNLRVSWSGHQTVKPGTTGVYDIAWMRFLQGDLRRGYALAGSTPLPGRRVVATPMHDTLLMNVLNPLAPAGSVRIGDDGSVAAIVPAGRAMTWEMLDNTSAKTSQVKERFWLTFQPGEVRTCGNCHGVNTFDQTGAMAPANPPAALATLLTQWKAAHPSGSMQFVAAVSSALKNAGNAVLTVMRSGGATGPVTVSYATANGTALAGIDYSATTGTLSWPDGDNSNKTISIPLLNNPVITANKSFAVALSAPAFGALGAIVAHTLTLAEPVAAPLTLDVDGNGSYDALTDGLLLVRYLGGQTGAALSRPASGLNTARSLSTDIALFLADLKPLLDVDGNSIVNLQDGIIIVRYMLGFRGAALVADIAGLGPRPVGQIESFIQALIP